MSKKALVWGGLFGLVAPFIGMFLGLQVSAIAGNILTFPLVGLSYVTGQPLGAWGAGLKVVALLSSVLVWAVIFGIAGKLIKRG